MGGLIPTETHLLRQIFQSLDSVSRLKLRRVCPLWNSVLSDADSGKTVQISFTANPFFPMDSENSANVYGVLGGMLKCIANSTERLIVQHIPRANDEGVLPIIGWMLRDTRIKQLIFHHGEVIWEEYVLKEDAAWGGRVAMWDGSAHKGIRRLVAALQGLAPVCAELRLYRCEFSISDQMTGVIPHATIRLDALDMEAQFWDLYEVHLSREEVDVEKVAEWIRSGSKELRKQVAQCLNNWQSLDPRSTTQYRDREWTEENLESLDVSKLTNLTLRAMKEIHSEDLECSDEEDNSSWKDFRKRYLEAGDNDESSEDDE
ncbi:uncharacterized protein LOC129600618 [Paramacrobiotus metropolitanus]|uniref:uncharacterized protein LOC129600618 n=1 Tax=Paramacrobiotus metropolitanus TaxID=2943436 RepID=UPI0024456836|nr:uncharacterized protein LOC129600618 [Paramacrobiotus metropolitanus]